MTIEDLRVHFPLRAAGRAKSTVKAVDGVTLAINRQETLAVVGESGSGKTTLARAAVGLQRPTSGQVKIDDRPVELGKSSVSMVFQDPFSSLNPRHRIVDIVSEPIRTKGMNSKNAREQALEALARVQLSGSTADKYPRFLSGGQRQRVAIARALISNPRLVVCDEPTSALDVSIQAEIVVLLRTLQAETGVSYLLISHDLALVRHLADRVAIMYLGRIVEVGTHGRVLGGPRHPYTLALLSAAPIPDAIAERNRNRIVLSGDLPDPSNPPKGCPFVTRCPMAIEVCHVANPPLVSIHGSDHLVACHRWREVDMPTVLDAAAQNNPGCQDSASSTC